LTSIGDCIPMIFITAYPNDAVRTRVFSAGAVCYLQKPFDHQSLMQWIGDALQRRGGEIVPDLARRRVRLCRRSVARI